MLVSVQREFLSGQVSGLPKLESSIHCSLASRPRALCHESLCRVSTQQHLGDYAPPVLNLSRSGCRYPHMSLIAHEPRGATPCFCPLQITCSILRLSTGQNLASADALLLLPQKSSRPDAPEVGNRGLHWLPCRMPPMSFRCECGRKNLLFPVQGRVFALEIRVFGRTDLL